MAINRVELRAAEEDAAIRAGIAVSQDAASIRPASACWTRSQASEMTLDKFIKEGREQEDERSTFCRSSCCNCIFVQEQQE